MNELGSYFRATLDTAKDEAQRDGSAAIEASHLLLAIAAGPDNPARQVLTSAGLDHQALRAALDREFERNLAAVGVSATAFGRPAASRAAGRPDKLGATCRQAIIRAMTIAGRKRTLAPAHLLIGVLGAQAGTVPRALALAGADPAALTEELGRELPGAHR
jgi:ATP-dependent Clp protease ATP-binding subunit ClpA